MKKVPCGLVVGVRNLCGALEEVFDERNFRGHDFVGQILKVEFRDPAFVSCDVPR